WRKIQRESFSRIDQLAQFLELSKEQTDQLDQKSPFPLNLPRRLALKMAKGTLDDPLIRQFLPLKEENAPSPFSEAPLEEERFLKTPKLLAKYRKRMLLVTTSACAMHCRYCFRRHFPYESAQSQFKAEIQAIRDDIEIEEVLLSGGDPLSLSDDRLIHLLTEIDQIPHVQRIRFHSRFLIGIPERATKELLNALEALRCQVIFVIHCNHARELDQDVLSALKNMQKLGIPILNQSVLLRGVNDTHEALQELNSRLINHGILPYYLHQLDQVKGAEHFEVSIREGHRLIAEMRESLPGYGVPRYVQEIPGEKSKTPL
ncbi:MAG: putative KamA family protein YjeK, partial [Chlamydiales bacterium]|nr:putative KamA family protein YjeK [Chlamydiales bacterium]